MNKKNTRKGFTIVELVIVIAVIAILATVLVPTFSNVIADAKDASLKQELKNQYTTYVAEAAKGDTYADDIIVVKDNKYYVVAAGVPNVTAHNTIADAANAMGATEGTVVVFDGTVKSICYNESHDYGMTDGVANTYGDCTNCDHVEPAPAQG